MTKIIFCKAVTKERFEIVAIIIVFNLKKKNGKHVELENATLNLIVALIVYFVVQQIIFYCTKIILKKEEHFIISHLVELSIMKINKCKLYI